MSEIKLKDFILDDIPDPKKKVVVTREQPEYDFKVEYENDTDFILRRRTAKTDRSLVCIVSQAQVYIKDNKTGDVERVIHKDQITKFKSGLLKAPAFEKLIWKPFVDERNWYGNRNEYTCKITEQFTEFLDDREVYKILANKKLNPFKENQLVREYRSSPDTFGKKLELIKVIQSIDPSFSINDYQGRDTVNGAFNCNIHQHFVDTNKDIIDELGNNSFLNWLRRSDFQGIIKDYNVDFKTFLTYLLYTIKYRNGLGISDYYGSASGSFTFSDYRDYLDNQKEMYGKIKEKYPQYWLSEKQMMCNKYNAWKQVQKALGFKINQEEMQKYEYTNEFFRVIVPLMSSDILDEAEQQQHCVASYVDRIRDGKTHIVFIRYDDKPEESLLTVEINTSGEICQVRGFMNRAYNRHEYDFMVEWAKKTGLVLKVKEPKEEDEEV